MSSAAVILGLTALAAGVEIADPLAALAVAGVIIVASIRLGKKTSLELMDTAPKEIVDRVARILRETPGVEGFDQLRVRTSGITHFVDVTIAIDRTCSFEQANQISRTLEARIKQEVGDADVVIHATPIALPREDLALKVRMLARNFPEIIDLHSMYVQEVGGRYVVEAHVSLEGNLPLARADAIAKAFEEKVRQDLVEVQEVLTHIDAVSPFQGSGEEITGQAPELIEQVRQVVEPLIPQWITEYRNLRITRIDHTHSLSLECLMNPDLSIEEAHSIAAQLEFLIREKVPGVGRIIVHAAPRPPAP
ncbi:MAG: hypothetical protein HYY85_00930 [Deltaproteobacteria bacterium]|nr:hypothetical protein [Deltaproteobacteria bacterium]